jgi:hypothetical protein
MAPPPPHNLLIPLLPFHNHQHHCLAFPSPIHPTQSLLFLLFLTVFPFILSLRFSFQIGLLKHDYREICPSLSSYTTWYSFIFFLLYPLGIPGFMLWALKFHGMGEVVKEKIRTANVSAMISLYIKSTCSTELLLFSRLVGYTDDDEEELSRQCKMQYDRLIKVQGGLGDMLWPSLYHKSLS